MTKFSEWIELRESRDSELKCPHPEDKEFCREWNRWIRGEISSPPEHKSKKALGHFDRRAGSMDTKKEKARKGSGQKGGRYDWRRDS
jgi:hypothetical protein